MQSCYIVVRFLQLLLQCVPLSQHVIDITCSSRCTRLRDSPRMRVRSSWREACRPCLGWSSAALSRYEWSGWWVMHCECEAIIFLLKHCTVRTVWACFARNIQMITMFITLHQDGFFIKQDDVWLVPRKNAKIWKTRPSPHLASQSARGTTAGACSSSSASPRAPGASPASRPTRCAAAQPWAPAPSAQARRSSACRPRRWRSARWRRFCSTYSLARSISISCFSLGTSAWSRWGALTPGLIVGLHLVWQSFGFLQ